MLGISHVVDGVATFANVNVYQIDVVAEIVDEKVAGSTHLVPILANVRSRPRLCNREQIKCFQIHAARMHTK